MHNKDDAKKRDAGVAQHIIAQAIMDTFFSGNELDRNAEQANVVDGLFAIARGLHDVADAIRGEVKATR
jgi:hypothetical protein